MEAITNTLASVVTFIETIKEYFPWLLVIFLTQIVKKTFFDNLIEWLRVVLSIAFPLVLSMVVFFIFSMPEFEFWFWLQSSLLSFAASIAGFNIGNNIMKIITAYLAKGK